MFFLEIDNANHFLEIDNAGNFLVIGIEVITVPVCAPKLRAYSSWTISFRAYECQ